MAVDWEPLPAVTDMWAAMAEATADPRRRAEEHPHQNQIKTGDPDAAFAAARRVVVQRMVSQRLCGVPISRAPAWPPRSPDRRDHGGRPPGAPQPPRDLASVLGMPVNLVRVINPDMGGGFGGSSAATPRT